MHPKRYPPTEVVVASKQLDFKMFIEMYDDRPPVAAVNCQSLKNWAANTGREFKERGTNAAAVYDRVTNYNQIWVRKSCDDYRNLMIKFLNDTYDNGFDFTKFDADHVVARARLVAFPDAWITVFPVRASWNRFFGAAEETLDFRVKAEQFEDGMYKMTGFEALKLFSSDISRIIREARNFFARESDNDTIRSLLGEMNDLQRL